MARIEPEGNPAYLTLQSAPAAGASAILPLVPDDELETPPLPREHPKWVKDAAAISARARALVAKMRPVIVRVLTFWDHNVRYLTVGGRTLSIDASGSYRVE